MNIIYTYTIYTNYTIYIQDVRALISMPLPGYVVEEAEEADGIDKTNTFKVSHKSPTGQKIYYFHADDRDTKQKYVISVTLVSV